MSLRGRGDRGRGRVSWGEPQPGLVVRMAERVRTLFGRPRTEVERLPALPAVLRRGELATSYLAAEGTSDHRRAAAAAVEASEQAIDSAAWWPADVWAHRALWHFEREGMELHAARAARRIGDVRVLAGDPASARRYYAEAISEARDLGAEREEGLAALGMGRAELELGSVTTARRLGQIAIDLLERCGAPDAEIAAAHELRGREKPVGTQAEEDE